MSLTGEWWIATGRITSIVVGHLTRMQCSGTTEAAGGSMQIYQFRCLDRDSRDRSRRDLARVALRWLLFFFFLFDQHAFHVKNMFRREISLRNVWLSRVNRFGLIPVYFFIFFSVFIYLFYWNSMFATLVANFEPKKKLASEERECNRRDHKIYENKVARSSEKCR